jgi:hypothetical protein
MVVVLLTPGLVRAQLHVTNTLLQIKRPDIDHPWGVGVTVHTRDVLTLRWKTTDKNVSKGGWQLSFENLGIGTNHPLSDVAAKGDAGSNRPALQFKEFQIDMKQLAFVPETPPTTAKVYWVRLVPYDSADQVIGTISLSVKITYVKATTNITSILWTPHGTFADLSFKTTTPTIPVVEVGTKPPSSDYTFKSEDVISSALPLLDGYQTNHTVRLLKLDPATQFHFVIRTKDKNGAVAGEKGTFNTLNRQVKIRFSKVLVKADSDDLSEGDLAFGFSVNGNRLLLAHFGAEDGTTHNLTTGNFDVNLTNPPTSLTLSVLGVDNDELEIIPVGPVVVVLLDKCGKLATGGDCDADAAEGSASFVYVTGPDEVFNKTFTIKSKPAKLKFDVSGTISVTYN